MPPEPLPWDRKDFFKERKHDRSSDSIGTVSRWREASHHGPSRWGSNEFRRPSGQGKQGGWHLHSEESGHGLMSSGSNEKSFDDDRVCGFRGIGKYGRNGRDSRGSCSQKDWKDQSWESTASPSGFGGPSDVNEQRLVDDILTPTSHPPHSDCLHSWDQHYFKEQQDKSGGVSGLGTGQRFDRENSLGSIDWKPMKWNRSGSLSSRGSGFSHSSSSKSMGVDSIETKAEAQPRTVTPVQSPSGDTAACFTSVALTEETISRKKPRLGWGEGLAKYEKKKVEGPDDNAAKDRMSIAGNNTEPMPSLVSTLADKSPRVTGFSECASPATPSSVACSSSPGMEDNKFVKGANIYNDSSVLSGSPGLLSQDHTEGLTFNLEKLELTSIANLNSNLSSSISELLQSDDPSLVGSGYVRSTARNKLLVWKGDILKALEMTESEIDSLENELKTFVPEPGSSSRCPSSSSSLPTECHANPCEELADASNLMLRPASLQIDSAVDMIIERPRNAHEEEEHAGVKDEDSDSPGTATSNFVEPLSLGKAVSQSDRVRCSECSENLDKHRSRQQDVIYGGEACQLIVSNRCASLSTDSDGGDILCESIFASNKEFANRASKVFNMLLPTNQCHTDISRVASVSCLQNDLLIKEKFAIRKRFVRFKERVLTLKFRAFQHLWKEDLRLLSMRNHRAKSQKKFDLSLRPGHTGYPKHRSSIRSRFLSAAGNLSLVPTTEIINFTSKLLSESQVKLYRNTLKMPSLILDKKEKMMSMLISSNGLVEDPCGVEKERTMINPWMPEEKEKFIDKLAIFGKDFRKIASFLDHKTTADCIEFYYKNHKSDCFEKAKKKPEFAKQGKPCSTSTYLVTSGKRWNREINAASLDMLGAASAIAANVDDGLDFQHKCKSRFVLGASSDYKVPRGEVGILERSSGVDIFANEGETVAADVLAGICGSLSSEAMSSCITSSVDPGECYPEWKCKKVGSSTRWPLTPEATQKVDDETCSDESCGEMDSADWTDGEKSIFIQAVASYGKDFNLISRCVQTRSRDQCKVFFSKARKCLGLDRIHPGPGNQGTPVSDEANGGGSDADDACIVETGPVISGDKLGSKMDEDLPFSELKINHGVSDPVGTINGLQPNRNQSEENNRPGKLGCKSSQLRSENLAPDDLQVEAKSELDLDGDSNVDIGISRELAADQESADLLSKPGTGRDEAIGPGTLEKTISVGAPNDDGLLTSPGADDVRGEVSAAEQELMLPKGSLSEKQVEHSSANKSGVTGSNCSIRNSNPVPLGATDVSDLVDDTHSSSGFGVISGYHHKANLELDSALKHRVVLLKQENFVTMNPRPHGSAAVQYENTLNNDTPSTLDLKKISDQQCQKSVSMDYYHQHLSGHSLLDPVESSHILRGYPLSMTTKKERDGDISCKQPASIQTISKSDRNLHSYRCLEQDRYLQKCNSSKHHGSMVELPFLAQEQTRDLPRPPYRRSSDVERPCKNGDVKLFGQILTHPSFQQKPNSSTHDNEDKSAQPPIKSSGKFFNLKFSGNQCADGNAALAKFDSNNHLGLENIPMRSYGFWDGKRIQTGFPSLPDSAILLAKYPAAFGNYSTSSSKMEQQPVHNVVKTSESTLNGATVFSRGEISSSNGVADYQVYRSRDGTRVQPFTLDSKQQQDLLLCEMQRRNRFEAVSSVQPQTKGMVGINVVGRGGILVGASCTGVSDPVAAIKMHYAKSEQYSAHAGSIIREEDSWRGKGDIGR
ncbi:unnamed protein product [Ilex paraguariensis]|uniref:SANT domain-containing protein n=1 Tax=Ilex paraguariensis TaxID=185542 RepID=A0ABC8QXS8_9AQUA